jgi:NADH-quinone oxidoreductase subunit N
MPFADLINKLITDSTMSLPLFSPELAIVITIVALLLSRLCNTERFVSGSSLALIGTLCGLILAGLLSWQVLVMGGDSSVPIFTGLLVYDSFTGFFRLFLLLFLTCVILLTKISGIPDRDDAPDFYTLLLGSTLGMMLMASANHLLIVFLGVEMTSVPSYAMVGFLKGRRQSSEAALKYVVYGAGAAGVMLYGISLLSGTLGTAHLPAMASALKAFGDSLGITGSGVGDLAILFKHPACRTLALSLLMILVGIAFKLSVFPFHFWCPDAFEGASAEVGGFLSVASKGAAFAVLIRLCQALVGSSPSSSAVLSTLYLHVGVGLGVAAAFTATFGNLAAYTQTNIKRMLAYSTIAHAGYMLMAVAALMVILNGGAPGVTASARASAAQFCVRGLLYYLSVYFFMNLGAFAIVALVRNQIFSEKIADYAGLAKQAPLLAVCLLVCLFSLIGLPPFGGFIGKFMIFASLFDAGQYHTAMYAVLVIGGLNTVFSLFYYLRVAKAMFLEDWGHEALPLQVAPRDGWFAFALSAPVLLLGIVVEPLSAVALNVAKSLF